MLPRARLNDPFAITFDQKFRHGEMLKGNEGFESAHFDYSQGLNVVLHQWLVELAGSGAETPEFKRQSNHVLRKLGGPPDVQIFSWQELGEGTGIGIGNSRRVPLDLSCQFKFPIRMRMGSSLFIVEEWLRLKKRSGASHVFDLS